MKEYGEMELNILSCLLLKPELMEQLIIEDKHIIQFKRMWTFMKAFYNKYKTFDLRLMYSVCKTKKDLMEYIEMVICTDAFTHNFNLYQNRLKEMFNEKQKDSWIINKVFNLSNDLYVRSITPAEFRTKLDKIYSDAEIIYKKSV